MAVAVVADRCLRSIVEHVPFQYWQPVDLRAPVFDRQLIDLIFTYLGTRA